MPACVPPPPATSSPDHAAVLVTRPEPGAGETAARITALGLRPIIAPLLMIAQRHATLPPSARVQAIVATSRNAIPALPASHRHLPLFAVGAATARHARAAGFEQVTSAEADAAALAALVAQTCDPLAGPLLLATGQDQGTALATNLRARGFRVVRRVVYAAVPATILPEPVHRPSPPAPCPPRCSSPPRPREPVSACSRPPGSTTRWQPSMPWLSDSPPPWHYSRSPGAASASPPSPIRTRCSRCCDE